MEKKIFNKEAALALVDNDKDILKILIDSFMSVTFSIDCLNKLISKKNYNEAAAYVHKTKGAGRQLCMERLADSGQELEDVLRGKKKGDISFLSKKMAADYETALKSAMLFNNN